MLPWDCWRSCYEIFFQALQLLITLFDLLLLDRQRRSKIAALLLSADQIRAEREDQQPKTQDRFRFDGKTLFLRARDKTYRLVLALRPLGYWAKLSFAIGAFEFIGANTVSTVRTKSCLDRGLSHQRFPA